MQTRWLNPNQERAMSIYMDKFGVDTGIRVIVDFEKGKSLGRAMIKHRDQQEGDCYESNISECVSI